MPFPSAAAREEPPHVFIHNALAYRYRHLAAHFGLRVDAFARGVDERQTNVLFKSISLPDGEYKYVDSVTMHPGYRSILTHGMRRSDSDGVIVGRRLLCDECSRSRIAKLMQSNVHFNILVNNCERLVSGTVAQSSLFLLVSALAIFSFLVGFIRMFVLLFFIACSVVVVVGAHKIYRDFFGVAIKPCAHLSIIKIKDGRVSVEYNEQHVQKKRG